MRAIFSDAVLRELMMGKSWIASVRPLVLGKPDSVPFGLVTIRWCALRFVLFYTPSSSALCSATIGIVARGHSSSCCWRPLLNMLVCVFPRSSRLHDSSRSQAQGAS